MNLDNLQKALTMIAAILCTGILVLMSILKIKYFPEVEITDIKLTLITAITSIILLVVAIRNGYITTIMIISMSILTNIYNAAIFKIFHKTIDKYITAIVSQPSFYPFTESAAKLNYKLFLILVYVVFLMLWLRYTVIIKHNMLER